MPKRKKGNTTQPPLTKCRSTHSTAATLHLRRNTTVTSCSNCNTTATLQHAHGNVATPEIQSLMTTGSVTTTTSTSETLNNTSVEATQLSPQTQQLISQLSNVIQLLTTSLSGNTLTNNPHPQVSLPDNNSAEMLLDVSDHPPVNAPPATTIIDNPHTSTADNPHTSTNDNQYTSTTEPLFNATQNPPVSLPGVSSFLRDKIISGELIDFTSM